MQALEFSFYFRETQLRRQSIIKPIFEDELEEIRHDDVVWGQDENKERGNWSGRLDFLLSCLAYAVGLGNVWRFPYLVYRNGGGAFFIPFLIMMIFCGMPLMFLELAFGQFASLGPLTIWKIAPLFKGLGYAMVIVSSLVGIYFNMIIAWTLFYLFASMQSNLPWAKCGNPWNTPACGELFRPKNCTPSDNDLSNCSRDTLDNSEYNSSYGSQIKAPSDEYFHNHVLTISEGIHDLGVPRWQLVLCLLLAWILIFLCLVRGIKSSGKVVYFTALFPYVVLLILLIRGATLEGYLDGIKYYVTPQWYRLKDAKVWNDAAIQIFFSLSPCWGGLITLSSYNRFHNNCYRDALIVCLLNCGTSVLAGFVIFAILGFMAHDIGTTVDNVVQEGSGLAFIAYPEAMTKLPVSPLWAILFFCMLLTLGVDSQFTIVETITTAIIDENPDLLRKRKVWVILTVCCVLFILGLSLTTRGGMYLLQLMDDNAAGWSVLIIGFIECIVIAWLYGIDRFFNDIYVMTGTRPGLWWRCMWQFVTPIIILFILFFAWIDYTPTKYGDYIYPHWSNVLGWLMALASVIAIPIWAIIAIFMSKGSFLERVKILICPSTDWGPALEKHRRLITYVPDFMVSLIKTSVSDNMNHKMKMAKLALNITDPPSPVKAVPFVCISRETIGPRFGKVSRATQTTADVKTQTDFDISEYSSLASQIQIEAEIVHQKLLDEKDVELLDNLIAELQDKKEFSDMREISSNETKPPPSYSDIIKDVQLPSSSNEFHKKLSIDLHKAIHPDDEEVWNERL